MGYLDDVRGYEMQKRQSTDLASEGGQCQPWPVCSLTRGASRRKLGGDFPMGMSVPGGAFLRSGERKYKLDWTFGEFSPRISVGIDYV